jgi:CRISPR-associated exonuclease Cas4
MVQMSTPDSPHDKLDLILAPEAPIRGVEVHYYVVCPRKCWLFLHGMEQEASSDLVALGRLLHETSFRREAQRNVEIEHFARVDFTKEGIVHEVKHGPSQHRAHVLQVAYYLWLLRQRGIDTTALIHYPRQRRRETVRLTPELEAALLEVLRRVRGLRQTETPPPVPRRMSICRSCAYDEFCWGDDLVEPDEE